MSHAASRILTNTTTATLFWTRCCAVRRNVYAAYHGHTNSATCLIVAVVRIRAEWGLGPWVIQVTHSQEHEHMRWAKAAV